MGVSLASMAKSWRVLTVGIAGLALFAAGSGLGPVQSAHAAICDDVELPATGSRTVSGCGGSQTPANATDVDEIHFAAGTIRADSVTETAAPRSNAQLVRSGRGSSAASSAPAASAASVNALPPRKTIDLSKLPASLVAPAR